MGLAEALELLDRSLAYTRVILAAVTRDRLPARTPCGAWDLDQLLAHMEDSLDAFAEGSSGTVRLRTTTPEACRVETLQHKACALLGAWSAEVPPSVTVGQHAVETSVLALAAALEITVHGWDVGRSLGLDRPIPESLATCLLPVADTLVTAADRGPRFAPPAPTRSSDGACVRLLAQVGRTMTGPLPQEWLKPGAEPGPAS